MKRKLIVVGLLLALTVAGGGSLYFYPYVFSITVDGVVTGVESAPAATVVAGGPGVPREQLFSYAVAIKAADGVIHTASSEERQWAVVKPGQCATARYYPYPPWNLQKSGTYHNARLLELRECAGK